MEFEPAAWVLKKDEVKTVRIRIVGVTEECRPIETDLVEHLSWELKSKNFRQPDHGGAADFEVDIVLKVRRLREERFLPEEMYVMRAELTATAWRAGDSRAVFRRLAVSRPEYSPSRLDACRAAALDALEEIHGHLLSAMGPARKAVKKE